jgi:hypothetical protein
MRACSAWCSSGGAGRSDQRPRRNVSSRAPLLRQREARDRLVERGQDAGLAARLRRRHESSFGLPGVRLAACQCSPRGTPPMGGSIPRAGVVLRVRVHAGLALFAAMQPPGSAGLADRERPRPAARCPRRALRRLTLSGRGSRSALRRSSAPGRSPVIRGTWAGFRAAGRRRRLVVREAFASKRVIATRPGTTNGGTSKRRGSILNAGHQPPPTARPRTITLAVKLALSRGPRLARAQLRGLHDPAVTLEEGRPI